MLSVNINLQTINVLESLIKAGKSAEKENMMKLRGSVSNVTTKKIILINLGLK